MAMTSNAGRGMTAEERDAFLISGAIFAKIATTMTDGWPVLSPVWFEWRAQDLAFLVVSKSRTSLVQNLHRDPRCSVLANNPELPYKRVSVLGETPRASTATARAQASGAFCSSSKSWASRRPSSASAGRSR